MGVKLYAMTCGTLTGALANLMEGGEGEELPDVAIHGSCVFYEYFEMKKRLLGAKAFYRVCDSCFNSLDANGEPGDD